MKVLLLYYYPPPPGGLSTQGDLLLKGLRAIGVEAHAVHLESELEKEWYYQWFKPDIVVGVGFWGDVPNIVHHPQGFKLCAVPWLVADGFIVDYQDTLNNLPLILVTSQWVKDVYIRDGIQGERIEVLPVGCDTDTFIPRSLDETRVAVIRQKFGITPDQVLILTVGGDGASKGAQEIMEALALIQKGAVSNKNGKSGGQPGVDWKYVCKVWPQERTLQQNKLDLELAARLGIAGRVHYWTDLVSRNCIPYLISACDIYAAPSRLEGFGMPQIEAGACGKPVVGIAAMGMLDTLIHGKTALLASVAKANYIQEATLEAPGSPGEFRRVQFDPPRIADYRADVGDLYNHLQSLINDAGLRQNLGMAAREHVVQQFDYRVVARRFVEIVTSRLGMA